MLKVKSVRTIGFVGDDERIVKELTTPFSRKKHSNCFYYKSALYRVENVEDAAVRVVVFSAVELYCGFEQLFDLCENPKSVVFITDCKMARKMGIKIDKGRLKYMLGCPVIFDKANSVSGLNKLLNAIHIVSDTPSYYTACENPMLARRCVLSLKESLFSRIIKIFSNRK